MFDPTTFHLPVTAAPRFPRGATLSTALLLVIAVGLTGCGGESNDAQGGTMTDVPRVRVETLVLTPTTFEDVIQITGNVEALDDATLSAQTAGTVVYLAPLGSFVPAGSAVARLDPAIASSSVEQAQARVDAAQAQFDLAEDNLRRNEPLYRDSVISAVEWESVRARFNEARANLAQANAALSQAREQLGQTRVTAPFSGSVERHFVELGEQVTPAHQVARVVNTGRVKVVAGVPERYAADIKEGTEVRIDFQAYRGQNLRSEVTFVGRAIDPDSRTFPIEIVVRNEGATLKPEMIAQVYVTREKIEDALVIPRSAVIRDEDGHSVFLIDREGEQTVVRKQQVVLGGSHSGEVVATNLRAGDEVVVLGQSNLTEGDPVQIMEQFDAPTDADFPTEDTTLVE